jgi:hypothetical protein
VSGFGSVVVGAVVVPGSVRLLSPPLVSDVPRGSRISFAVSTLRSPLRQARTRNFARAPATRVDASATASPWRITGPSVSRTTSTRPVSDAPGRTDTASVVTCVMRPANDVLAQTTTGFGRLPDAPPPTSASASGAATAATRAATSAAVSFFMPHDLQLD